MKIFAHRGASGLAPENTMSAFKLAEELGAYGIELDVQLTRDGQLVVIHDEQIDRTSNGRGWVLEHSLVELQSYDFGSWFSEEYQGETIPTLQEVLGWIKDTDMTLNIELKAVPALNYTGMAEKTLQQVYQTGMQHRVIISSFDHDILQEVRALDAEIPIGVLYDANILQLGTYCQTHQFDAVHPPYLFVNQRLVSEWKEANLAVNVWTVNTKAEADRLQQCGVDSIITNYPNCLR